MKLFKFASRKRKIQFYLLFLLSILASLAELLSIGAVIPFIGIISDPERIFEMDITKAFLKYTSITSSQELLFPLTVFFAMAVIIAASFRILLLWVRTRLSFAFGADISISMYERTLYQPYRIHTSRNTGDVIATIIGKSSDVIFGIVLPVLTLLTSLILALSIIIFIFILEPFIGSLVFFSFGIIYALIAYFTRKILSRDSQRIAKERTRSVEAIQDGLGSIREVLLDGTQNAFKGNYTQSDLALRRAQGNNKFVSELPRFLLEGLGMLIIAVAAYLSAISSESFSNTIPLLAGLALGAQRALPALQGIYNSWVMINGFIFSLKDVLEYLDQEFVPKKLEQNVPLVFNKQFELKNINFTFQDETKPLFRNFNLIIPKGSKVGIKGTTGSGKSTLIDIIVGLIEPDKGQIVVDGSPINSENLRSWQSLIAEIPQSIFISDKSLGSNIAFAIDEKDIDYERIDQVIEVSQLNNLVSDLPRGYKEQVGERGALLSGGQIQRIGIARALYKKPQILIMDEATSALDVLTEAKVIQSIIDYGKDITIIMIAHRLTTLESCDFIIDLDNL